MLKRIIIFLTLAIAVLAPGCSFPLMDEEDYDRLPPLFEPVEFTDFNLAEALDEAQRHIEAHSIFWKATEHPEIMEIFEKHSLAPQARDMDYVRKSVLINFFAFLSVPESLIPQWAWDLLEKGQGYSFINEVYRRVIQEPRYAHLQEPDRKEALLKFMIGDGEKRTGLIGALGDPFVWYVSASAVKAGYWPELLGEYVGIGIKAGLGEGKRFVVKKVTDGSPADRAGIKVGDVILAIDRKSPLKSSREQVNAYFNGLAGTSVLLTIKDLAGNIKNVKLVRERIEEKYVFSWPGVELPEGRGNTAELLPFSPPLRDRQGQEVKNILYLSLHCFKPYVVDDVRTILTSLNLEDYIGIIIDLRDNAGGLGDKDMADFFLEDKAVMAIEVYNNGTKNIQSQDKEDLAVDIPVVILIGSKNQFFMGTWSAGEVFAATMHDNKRAVLIGEKTPGKGTAVHYAELGGGKYGAIVIGVMIWLTPSGEWIEGQDSDGDGYYESGGIKPDIEVKWTDEDYKEHNINPNHDPTIFEAIDYLTGLQK